MVHRFDLVDIGGIACGCHHSLLLTRGGDETASAHEQGVLKQMLASARVKLEAATGGGAAASASGAAAESKREAETATFAAGCFWGGDVVMKRLWTHETAV